MDDAGLSEKPCPFSVGRVGGIKPFYRGAKVSAIGAISLKKVVAVMTLHD